MKTAQDIILAPVITENSMEAMSQRKYTFKVAKTANKIEIAKAVETIFNVKVVKVNTLNVKPKPKRYRTNPVPGATRTWKKAMVTLAEGETIEVFGA